MKIVIIIMINIYVSHKSLLYIYLCLILVATYLTIPVIPV